MKNATPFLRELLVDPNKTRQLVLRETAFAQKKYKNYAQLIHGLMQVENNDLCARSTSDSCQASRTHPPCNLKAIEEYGDSRSQEREPVSTLDS